MTIYDRRNGGSRQAGASKEAGAVMSPADLALRIAALDWSETSLQHQLAVTAAVETLKSLTGKAEPMTLLEAISGIAFRKINADGSCETVDAAEVLSGVAINQIYQASRNVVALPVRPRTCWTTLCQLDGRPWATSSHFGPEGAWGWIVESVMHEHGVSEDQVGCAESGEDQPYDCDDLVTIDGLPVYRIQHCC